jgi:hypothetical protein
VFIASPSDVAQEREVIAKAIEELNRALGTAMGVHLEAVRWEKDTYPAIGSDPQNIVNRQISDNYDVFIGLLWTRFGTPTPRAESGTIEEFQRAKLRFEKDPNSISVMIYFKEEPISPSQIDAEQLARVHKFRKDLEKEALYGTFNSQEELGSNVRIHLTRILLERRALYHGTDTFPRQAPNSTAQGSGEKESEKHSESDSKEEPEDEGLLDLVIRGTTSITTANGIIHNMTSHLQELTIGINNASTEMQSVDISQGQQEVQKAMAVVDDLANKMDIFSDQIQEELTGFEFFYSNAMRAYGKAVLVIPAFGEGSNETLEHNKESIRSMADAIPPARESMLGLRASIEKLPPVTTKFNKSKTKIQKALSDVDRQFSAAHTLTSEVIKLIETQTTSPQSQ